MLLKRPRNVNSSRAAAILYGDWGTSKAYVLGIAFAMAGYASFYLILAMVVFTAIVGINYIWVCKHYPDGGGVYSSVRHRNRTLAVIGALLLIADYTVTASLSTFDAFHYLDFQHPEWWAVGTLALIGFMNYFGPRHSGSLAVAIALPAVLVVLVLAVSAIPHLGQVHTVPMEGGFKNYWLGFVGIVLALSGVEAIANMAGVMEADKGSSPDHPTVHITARRAILPVLLEVTVFTALLGLAMHAIPEMSRTAHTEDMLRHMGDFFIGPWFGRVVGLVFAFLLFSAANTAVIGLVSILYLLSRDNEMPRAFSRLNRYGVPSIPLAIATVLPIIVVLISPDVTSLAALYAIGVVGAITINLGACSTNFKLNLARHERAIMMATFAVALCVELTIAYEKRHALIFAFSVLAVGLATRGVGRVLHTRHERAERIAPPLPEPVPLPAFHGTLPVNAVLVAVRGATDTLRFATEEARLRNAALYVLFVREINVSVPAGESIAEDTEARRVFEAAKQGADGVPIIPIYAVSDSPEDVILDQAATLGVDYVILGSTARSRMVRLLKGDLITRIAERLPEEIKLIIYG
ncbi:MAG: amino acid permease [Candidatus Latescibacteria bacterium]|nr:amino acid permease [Candidatus Latescibacterota bacterium]